MFVKSQTYTRCFRSLLFSSPFSPSQQHLIKPPTLNGAQQVAVLIAQADTAGAVKTLNGYLAEFAADGEAWLQLAKLHVGALNYEVRE